MTNKKLLKVTAYAAIFGLVGGMSFEGVNYVSNKYINPTAIEKESTASNTTINKVATLSTTSTGESSDGVSDVAENVLPSIVAIDVTATETSTDIFGRSYQQDAEGSGSGIIVGQDDKYLYIATNNHVVADANSVSVKFNDDSVYSATVKGTDSDSDLAVVEVKVSDLSSDTLGNIKVATLGNSDEIKVGAQAIAIGNALGYGTSVTVGYISAKDREVSGEDNNMKLLQTDAAINPGNSGGALVDSKGAVIGINSSKYAETSVEGMGFAIPINTATPIINSIIKAEKVSEDEQAYLGIRGTDVSSEYAEYYNMPQGIYVSEATENAPASKAGIQKGDIIVKFNGSDVKSMEGLQEKLALCKAGDKVEVVVKRADNGEYKEKKVTVTLGKKAEAEDDNNSDNSNNSRQNGTTGNNGNSRNGSGQNGYGFSQGGNSQGGSSFGSGFGW